MRALLMVMLLWLLAPPALAQNDALPTCELGLHKCDVLRNEALPYWSCMQDTCNTPQTQTNPSCKRGHQSCQQRLKEYYFCVDVSCGNAVNEAGSCERAELECAGSLRDYWSCVKAGCLGDAYKYRDPANQISLPQDLLENTRPPKTPVIPLKGVHERFKFPPAGIEPLEWRSAIPPERRINGSPGNDLECQYGATLICESQDLLSCFCSNGLDPLPR